MLQRRIMLILALCLSLTLLAACVGAAPQNEPQNEPQGEPDAVSCYPEDEPPQAAVPEAPVTPGAAEEAPAEKAAAADDEAVPAGALDAAGEPEQTAEEALQQSVPAIAEQSPADTPQTGFLPDTDESDALPFWPRRVPEDEIELPTLPEPRGPIEYILPVEPRIYESESVPSAPVMTDAGADAICGLPVASESVTELTHEKALADAAFGGCFPSAAPAGFQAESISRGEDALTGLWTNGYRELYWNVRAFTDADSARVTAVQDTKNYDLALYPIPRADSVPEALREIVNDPIFDAETLTQDVVNARTYEGDEAYDCMAFSVKYGDVLVTVRAKGVSPAWVFAQLSALAGS